MTPNLGSRWSKYLLEMWTNTTDQTDIVVMMFFELFPLRKNSIITFAWSHPILLNSHFIGISSHSSASCCFIFLRDSPATPQCSHDKGVSAHSIFTCCYRKGVMKSKIKFKRYILLIIKTTSSRQFKKIKNKTQSEPRDNSQVF